jgi:hypothetical protein
MSPPTVQAFSSGSPVPMPRCSITRPLRACDRFARRIPVAKPCPVL